VSESDERRPLPYPGPPGGQIPCVVAEVRGDLDITNPVTVLNSVVQTVNLALAALEAALQRHGATLKRPRIAVKMHPAVPLCIVTAISLAKAAVRDAVTAEAQMLAKAPRKRVNGAARIALPPGVSR